MDQSHGADTAQSDLLERGREAFRKRRWADAYAALSRSRYEAGLGPLDLERLALVAYLIGNDDESTDAWTHAYQAFADRGETISAARCAFWMGLSLLDKGQLSRGGGWISRGQRLIDDGDHDCVERGFLLLPSALQSLEQGDGPAAYATFREAAEIARRFNDSDLATLALLGQGQALILQNTIAEGISLLDEAMVTVESDEIAPIVVGIVYCAVIEQCHRIYDLRRAREWTAVLSRWCESQPDLVPYRGQCQVRRAEIMQLHGEWSDAMNEVSRACELLARPPGEPAAGLAFYRKAELHRLRGEFSRAEQAYRDATKWGHTPQPGLALLWLAQGRRQAAQTAIDRALADEQDRLSRSRILPAQIDIMLESDQPEADELHRARTAAEELTGIATGVDSPFLTGMAGRAMGAVFLAEGSPDAALETLRRAWASFKDSGAAYEAARVRVLMALACLALEDRDSAHWELDAAWWAFRQLDAGPDLARVEAISGRRHIRETHGLTPRELEVLRLVAGGRTNKSIAAELFVSERTVDRHVSNIFTKLDVPSRAAATAYAFRHNLV